MKLQKCCELCDNKPKLIEVYVLELIDGVAITMMDETIHYLQ